MRSLKKQGTKKTEDTSSKRSNEIVITDDLAGVAPATTPLPGRPITVLCPLHKTPLPLQIEGERKFAVCQCDVPGNKHKGQVVWERKSI